MLYLGVEGTLWLDEGLRKGAGIDSLRAIYSFGNSADRDRRYSQGARRASARSIEKVRLHSLRRESFRDLAQNAPVVECRHRLLIEGPSYLCKKGSRLQIA